MRFGWASMYIDRVTRLDGLESSLESRRLENLLKWLNQNGWFWLCVIIETIWSSATEWLQSIEYIIVTLCGLSEWHFSFLSLLLMSLSLMRRLLVIFTHSLSLSPLWSNGLWALFDKSPAFRTHFAFRKVIKFSHFETNNQPKWIEDTCRKSILWLLYKHCLRLFFPLALMISFEIGVFVELRAPLFNEYTRSFTHSPAKSFILLVDEDCSSHLIWYGWFRWNLCKMREGQGEVPFIPWNPSYFK